MKKMIHKVKGKTQALVSSDTPYQCVICLLFNPPTQQIVGYRYEILVSSPALKVKIQHLILINKKIIQRPAIETSIMFVMFFDI